jgi:hypothetical protein
MPETAIAPSGITGELNNFEDIKHTGYNHLPENNFGGEAIAEAPVFESLLNEISSEEGLKKITTAWDLELEDSEMQHIARLEETINNLDEESRRSDDWQVHQQKDKSIKRIRELQKQLFGTKVGRYHDIISMKSYLERNKSLMIRGEGAREIAAPFLDSQVMYNPEDGAQRFVNSDSLAQSLRTTEVAVVLSDDGCMPFEIPLKAIISASGFESWVGRGTEESRAKIEDYATRETEIPPIKDQLHALVLPNGKIAFLSENAHRVAAAIKKGQDSIGFTGILHVTRLAKMPTGLY